MSIGDMARVKRLQGYISSLLLAAGVLLALAGLNRAIVFLDEGYEAQPVSGPLLLLGILAATLAIIGIYSRTRERIPTLAKVTGAFATLSLLAFVIFLVWTIGSRVASIPEATPVLAILGLVSFIIGSTLAGVTVLRSSIYQPLVGYLLIAEALTLVAVALTFSLIFPERDPTVVSMAFEVAQGVILLSAGHLTRDSSGIRHQQTAV